MRKYNAVPSTKQQQPDENYAIANGEGGGGVLSQTVSALCQLNSPDIKYTFKQIIIDADTWTSIHLPTYIRTYIHTYMLTYIAK